MPGRTDFGFLQDPSPDGRYLGSNSRGRPSSGRADTAKEERNVRELVAEHLTARVREALAELPRGLHETHVFLNPKTGKPWRDVRTMFRRACRDAGIHGLWFHDLRRSFVTNARRRGIPESVVMRMSGHRTRAVFDRYNIISETDLVEALGRLEAGQRAELRQDSGKAAADRPEEEKPRRLSTGEARTSG
ncbi:MAG TPA: tyrosine-type recombinase/integrase [Haliangiales bacterium]|nr:tyrosine-type recombinase/integrase [Haliangiales bacterium]